MENANYKSKLNCCCPSPPRWPHLRHPRTPFGTLLIQTLRLQCIPTRMLLPFFSSICDCSLFANKMYFLLLQVSVLTTSHTNIGVCPENGISEVTKKNINGIHQLGGWCWGTTSRAWAFLLPVLCVCVCGLCVYAAGRNFWKTTKPLSPEKRENIHFLPILQTWNRGELVAHLGPPSTVVVPFNGAHMEDQSYLAYKVPCLTFIIHKNDKIRQVRHGT